MPSDNVNNNEGSGEHDLMGILMFSQGLQVIVIYIVAETINFDCK